MNKQEEDLLSRFKRIWPEIQWPEAIESYNKEDYPAFFIKDLKDLIASLSEKDTPLSFIETAINIFWQRLETQFKPEIIQKKTKLKTPKLGALETIECSKCASATGVWVEARELPLVREVELVCSECQAVLSDRVQIAKTVAAKPKTERIAKPAKPKKPTKKELEEFTAMKSTMEKFNFPLEDYEKDLQELYNKCLTWEQENGKV